MLDTLRYFGRLRRRERSGVRGVERESRYADCALTALEKTASRNFRQRVESDSFFVEVCAS